MKIKVERNISIHQFLIFMAVWSSFIKMAVNDRMHDIVAIISVLFGIVLMVYAICRLRIPHIIWIIWMTFLVAGLLNIIFVGNLYITVFASIMLSYFPISLNIVFSDRLSCGFWKWNYIAAGGYLIFRLMTSSDGVLLFYNLSRNNLSVLLLAWLIIYAVALQKNNRKIPMWAILLYFFCCVAAIGRFGIFVAGIILVAYWAYYFFYHNYYDYRVHDKFLIGIFSLIIILFVIGRNGSFVFNKVFSRFAEVGFAGSEERLGMVKDYFAAWRSQRAMILGADRTMIYSIAIRDGNPHNSYVFTHMYFGIAGLLFLVFGGLKAIMRLFKTKQYGLLILAVGYFLRIFTDSVFPGSFGGDVAFWIFIFGVIQNSLFKKYTRRNKNEVL